MKEENAQEVVENLNGKKLRHNPILAQVSYNNVKSRSKKEDTAMLDAFNKDASPAKRASAASPDKAMSITARLKASAEARDAAYNSDEMPELDTMDEEENEEMPELDCEEEEEDEEDMPDLETDSPPSPPKPQRSHNKPQTSTHSNNVSDISQGMSRLSTSQDNGSNNSKGQSSANKNTIRNNGEQNNGRGGHTSGPHNGIGPHNAPHRSRRVSRDSLLGPGPGYGQPYGPGPYPHGPMGPGGEMPFHPPRHHHMGHPPPFPHRPPPHQQYPHPPRHFHDPRPQYHQRPHQQKPHHPTSPGGPGLEDPACVEAVYDVLSKNNGDHLHTEGGGGYYKSWYAGR